MTRATTGKDLQQQQQPQSQGATPATMDFPRLLEASKGEIARVLPEGVNVERVCRMALTAFRMNPDIRDCTPQSILASVMKAAELGLEPNGGMKQCWLIPFNDRKRNIKECTFVIGYQGVLELARRSGAFRMIDARVVLDTDEFSLEYHPAAQLRHVPDLTEAGAEIGAYAYVLLAGGEMVVEWMSRKTLEKIRAGSRQQSIWEQWWGEKAKNAALKRLLKRQPLSVQLRRAIEIDDEQESPEREPTAIAPQFRQGNQPALTASARLGQRLRGGSEPEVEAIIADALPAAEGEEPDVYASEGGANN